MTEALASCKGGSYSLLLLTKSILTLCFSLHLTDLQCLGRNHSSSRTEYSSFHILKACSGCDFLNHFLNFLRVVVPHDVERRYSCLPSEWEIWERKMQIWLLMNPLVFFFFFNHHVRLTLSSGFSFEKYCSSTLWPWLPMQYPLPASQNQQHSQLQSSALTSAQTLLPP